MPTHETSPVTEFIGRAGHLPYRDYIAHVMKGKSSEELRIGGTEFVSRLPPSCQKLTLEFIDAVNDKFLNDETFWRTVDCKTAFGRVMQTAIQVLPLGPGIEAEIDAYEEANQELAFDVFWVATIAFAYSASGQRALRKFMGIRKGFLG
ncbi:MAG: hypothetical protein O2854_08160 [Chloroflexi bacterium]|nr:hypothetical protein [Chloroflexota bacterium]